MPFRAFAAVKVPPSPLLERALGELAQAGADLKIVAPDNLHLTLAFLGDVPDDAPGRAEAAFERATADAAPFRLVIRGVGAFPNPRRPRVVWAGLAEPAPLLALAERVRAELAREGLRGDDKPFKAHVTLARVREGGRLGSLPAFLDAHADDDLGRLRVDEVRLYRSTLTPQGPRYDIAARRPLLEAS